MLGGKIVRQGMRILDFHVHFLYRQPDAPRGRIREANSYAGRQYRSMLRAWDYPEPEPEPPEPDAALERWMADLDAKGIDQVLFVTGPGPEFMARAMERYPGRVYALAHPDPNRPEAADELRRALDMGLRGMKAFAPRFDRPFEDPSYRPLWEILAERRLPLLIHFGILGGGGGVAYHPRMSPLTISLVAKEYPEMPIVVPHFGAGYWQDLLQLGWTSENVYVDTSGSNQWVRWMPYPLDLDSLFRKAYETFGPERMIFGSDSSWFPRGFADRYLQDQLRVCRHMGMRDEDIALIFGGNARRLLRLEDSSSTFP
jgi:predicted TIM-barrel fold metal-dependent hydrolase